MEPVGEVTDVYELPQGLMLDVRRPTGSVLIPFRPEVVTHVDVAARRIEIDPPDGLIE
jgi:16S rRNA processing protein RimM